MMVSFMPMEFSVSTGSPRYFAHATCDALAAAVSKGAIAGGGLPGGRAAGAFEGDATGGAARAGVVDVLAEGRAGGVALLVPLKTTRKPVSSQASCGASAYRNPEKINLPADSKAPPLVERFVPEDDPCGSVPPVRDFSNQSWHHSTTFPYMS
jgi:hypothetical protein